MQTFITDTNMAISASYLDNKRLGKQRVEALQIFECLIVKETRWKNHPAVQMWKGFEGYLLYDYIIRILNEWELVRKFKNTKCIEKWYKYTSLVNILNRQKPPWITEKFIEAHRSNLIRKDPNYYKPLFPNTQEGLEYIWPTKEKPNE